MTTAKPAQATRAFSLVEVALSLGIVAFSVVAIMGLLATGINSGKASTDDTQVAAMAALVINDVRHLYFMDTKLGRTGGNYNLHVANPNGVLAGTDDVAAGTSPQAVTSYVYFDVSGARLQTGTPAVDLTPGDSPASQGAIYQCVVTSLADAATLSATSTDATPVATAQATNLLQVTMTFTWPIGAKAPGTKTFNATLARY